MGDPLLGEKVAALAGEALAGLLGEAGFGEDVQRADGIAHERLQVRMNQFFDRFESTLKQSLRVASDGDAAGRAAALVRYAVGSLHVFAKSGFAKKPGEGFSGQRRYLLA